MFSPSVPMSTYVACFIVADFVHKEQKVVTNGIGSDFKMRVYSRPSELNKVDFALKSGVALTEYFIQYFQTKYPLPKLGMWNCVGVFDFFLQWFSLTLFYYFILDMVAIPDFVSGAMEHWGLVRSFICILFTKL